MAKKLPVCKCSVDGCDRIADRPKSGLCEMHYYRQRRTGTTTRVYKVAKPYVIAGRGYVQEFNPSHPLARGQYVPHHRRVYYDANGLGPFNCHWCQKHVTWESLHIDHVDDDKQNNKLDNLVASCAYCNQHRNRKKARTTWRAKTGITVDGVTKTAFEWEAEAAVSRSGFLDRIRRGWDAKSAIFTPRNKKPYI